jgi:hypothetical protein
VSGGPRFEGNGIAVPGSPVAVLMAEADAALAAGLVACACPHPATATRLHWPGRLLGCPECVCEMQAAIDEATPATCGCCGAAATRGTAWISAGVFAWIRLCDRCHAVSSLTASVN